MLESHVQVKLLRKFNTLIDPAHLALFRYFNCELALFVKCLQVENDLIALNVQKWVLMNWATQKIPV